MLTSRGGRLGEHVRRSFDYCQASTALSFGASDRNHVMDFSLYLDLLAFLSLSFLLCAIELSFSYANPFT